MKRNATRVPSFGHSRNTTRAILALFLAISASANAQETDGGVPEQTLSLKASGLYLTANPLDAPAGSLVTAKNVVVRRRGVAEPRRGQAPDAAIPGGAGTTIDAMTSFEGSVIAHTDGGKLVRRDSNVAMTAYSGNYSPPENGPTRFIEAGGGLYTTTEQGLYRLDSPTSQPTPAGVPPGLEGSATVTGTAGWLPFNGTVAYRLVWGRRDGDGALMLGAPSGRIIVNNLAQNSPQVVFTWSRAATVVTVTSASHGRANGDTVTVTGSSDERALPIGSYVVSNVTTNTFDVTGLDAGATSGSSGNLYAVGGGSRDTTITTPIPDGIEYGVHFLQVYRTTATYTGSQDPGEYMAQVAEVFPTQTEIAAGLMTATDIASFANGPTAYFNPNNGRGGIADSHVEPPVLTDVVNFRNYAIGVVRAYSQVLDLSILAVGGFAGLQYAEGLVIAQGAITETYLGMPAEDVAAREFYLDVPNPSAASALEVTARSLVRVINQASSIVYATYSSGQDDLPGKLVLFERGVGGETISVRQRGTTASITPSLQKDFFAVFPTARAGNITTIQVPNTAGLKVGQPITAFTSWDTPADQANFPTVTATILAIGPNSFTISDPGPDVTMLGSQMGCVAGEAADSEMNQYAVPGSWAISSYEEPDAWPPRFRFKIEGENTVLYRISPQGEALLFWTSAGLYRLSGTDETNFILTPLDPNVQLVAPESVQTLNNKAIALTDQGIITVSDVGVDKISEPLDELLLPYYSGEDEAKARLAADAYAIKYETENEYILFLPDLNEEIGSAPKQAYTFNAQTSTWVGPWEWTWDGDASQEAGRIQTAHVASDGRLYLASGNKLFRERKSRTLSDYQDDTGTGIPVDVAYTLQTAKNPAAYKQWVETTMLLENPQPDSAFIYFKTEIDTNEEGGTVTNKGYNAIRTYVPLNKSRSARLTVGLRNQIAGQKLSILGVSQNYNTASTRIGR